MCVIGSKCYEDVNGVMCEKTHPDLPPNANVQFTVRPSFCILNYKLKSIDMANRIKLFKDDVNLLKLTSIDLHHNTQTIYHVRNNFSFENQKLSQLM